MKQVYKLAVLAVCFCLAACGASVSTQPPAERQIENVGISPQARQEGSLTVVQIRVLGSVIDAAHNGVWSYVTLELDTTDEQMISLRPTLVKSLKETRGILDVIDEDREEPDPDALRQSVNRKLSDLRDSVRDQLTDEQKEKLDDWFIEQEAMLQRMRQLNRRR